VSKLLNLSREVGNDPTRVALKGCR
jgi:hypothetical protein